MADLWIILALSAVFLYGIGQVIGKVAIESLDATSMVAINFVVSMPAYVFLLLSSLLILGPPQVELIYVLFGLIAATLGRAGYYVYMEALEEGPVTIVGSITAAYPAIIAILAVTVLGESLTILQSVGVAVVILGMIGISFTHRLSGSGAGFTKRSLTLSCVTLALWGVWGLFVKLALNQLSIVFYLGLYAVILPPLFYAYIRHKKVTSNQFLPKWSHPAKIAVISVLIGIIALLCDTSAVSIGEAAVVFPLIAAYPVVMILLAFGFLKERLSRWDWSLVTAVILGIIMISTT